MPQQRTNLKAAFWYIVVCIGIYLAMNIKVDSLPVIGAAVLIFATVMGALYLWVIKKPDGIPIFPVFSFPLIFKYAVPIVSNSLTIKLYSPESKWYAGMTVVVFLASGILGWSYFLNKKPVVPKRFLALQGASASYSTFLVVLFLDLILRMNQAGHWFYLGLAVQNFLDLVSLGTALLGVFFLAYRWGTGELKKQKYLFFTLVTGLMIAFSMSLYLIEVMTTAIAMVAGYFLGSKRVPLMLMVLLFLPVFYLQYGKGEIRDKHWVSVENGTPGWEQVLQPWQYPSILWEWAQDASHELSYRAKDPMYTSHVQPLLERSSMIQLLLIVQEQTPKEIPYYYGATYQYILGSMVPRFINPQKVSPLIGGKMLSLRYGLVSEEEVDSTFISWDMLIEAYVNFGLGGCVILGAFLGLILGWVEYWSAGLPVYSFRFLFSAIILLYGFKASEMVFNTFVVSLFQTAVGLFLMAFLLMRFYKIKSNFGKPLVPYWLRTENKA